MTLTLSKLGSQLDGMGRELAGREEKYQQLLAIAWQLLQEHSDHYEVLQKRAHTARARKWQGAIPADEPLLKTHPLPPHPPQAALIAADGSQVEPDRHGVALYALVNIGSIVFEHGTGKRPQVESEPHLFYKDEDLYEDKRLLQGNLLDIRRDTAELQKLADLARAAESGPLLTLTDGTLLLWVLEEAPAARKQARLQRYLACLDSLRSSRAAVAAFTSRPRHAEVINLLHLASLGDDPTPEEIEKNPLEGLMDRALFRFLSPGERSTFFVSSVAINAEYRRHRADDEIGFFYLNVGDERHAEIARIELPYWVATTRSSYQPGPPWAGDYRLIDFIQAAIYEQCRVSRGYPYILARAHELALVSVEEQRDLEMRVIAAMARHGLDARPSEKARLKELTGGGKRRYRI